MIRADEYNVGDLVTDFLVYNKIKTTFGVISVHNIPMLEAISKRNDINFIPARGEMGAGHMADGFARSCAGVGVVFTSTGPGAANVCGALVEARFASTPLLHITGQTVTENLDKQQGTVHDVPDQLNMLASVSKKAFRIIDTVKVLSTLEDALKCAITPPRGPVSVEIPIDIQRSKIKKPEIFKKIKVNYQKLFLGKISTIKKIEDEIKNSKRKILWVGNGAKELREEVDFFSKRGFMIVTSTQAKGVINEVNEMCVGSFNSLPIVEKFYSTADLMIVVGSRLRGHETKDMTLKLPHNLIQIDIDPKAENRTYKTKIFHLGDAKKVLNELKKRMKYFTSLDENWSNEVKLLKKRINFEYRAFIKNYKDFPSIIRKHLPKGGRWIRDVTISNSTWGNRMIPLNSPKENIYPVGAGIGPALPMAIGASLACKEIKSIMMSGDGGFMLNLPELWTAVEVNSNLIFLVMNDNGYGVIKHIQDSLYGGRNVYADLKVPNFSELAFTLKIPYLKVKSAKEFEKVIKKAFTIFGPVLIEVDIKSVGDLPRYFTPPPFTKN